VAEDSLSMAGARGTGYRLSVALRARRAFLRWLFRIIFHILCRIRVEGKENIPKKGSYLIAFNHISLFEPPLVLCFWPSAPEAIAGADVFERPWQKILVRGYAAIPVHRGEYDRKVIDAMLAALRAGQPLAIAPEGGRSHTPGLRRALPGVAHMVDQANVPVVPVGVVGSTEDMLKRALRGKRPLLEMKIGKAFLPPRLEGKGADRREMRQANADMVMRAIAALLPADYRGVYE